MALGSNLGDRAAHLREAVHGLDALPRTKVVGQSSIHETAAMLPPENPAAQPSYLNSVVELDTQVTADVLHAELKALETRLGRIASTRWAPRVIDLDLLFLDEQVLSTPTLTLPHPRLHERRFVLEPMVELAPEFQHPLLQRSMRQLLNALM